MNLDFAGLPLTNTLPIQSLNAGICRTNFIGLENFDSTEKDSETSSRRNSKLKSGCRMLADFQSAGKPETIFNSPASASGLTPNKPSTSARDVVPMPSPKSRRSEERRVGKECR